jgi:hypothetical protein
MAEETKSNVIRLGYHTTINPTSIRGFSRRQIEQIDNPRDRERALALWEEQRARTDTPERKMQEQAAWGVFAHPDDDAALARAQSAEEPEVTDEGDFPVEEVGDEDTDDEGKPRARRRKG